MMVFASLHTLEKLLPLLLLPGVLLTAQSAPASNSQLASTDLNARVDALLKQMTLEEKIGQLAQYSAGYATGPGASNLRYDETGGQGPGGIVAECGRRRGHQSLPASLLWKSRACIFRSSSGWT